MKEILNSTTRFVLVLVILSIIILTFLWKEINEPLKTISLMIVSFYFGAKASNQTQIWQNS